MRSRLPPLTLPLLAPLLFVSPTPAGPPLLTDDPWTRPAGQYEINLAYVPTLSRQTSVQQAPFFNPDYNITDNVQVNYAAAWLVEEQGNQGVHSGLSNSLVSVKWRFLDQDQAGLAVAVTPRLEFNNPTSSVHTGLVNSGTVFTLPVEVGRTTGPYTVFAEAGYQFTQFRQDTLFLGLAGGYQLTPDLQLLAELFTLSDASFNDIEPIADVGLILAASDHLNLLLSLGRGLRDTPNSPYFVMYAGIQLHY